MSRYRILVVAEAVAAVAALALSFRLQEVAATTGAQLLLLATAMTAAAVLTGFGIWLPRGDTVDNSAALAFLVAAFTSPAFAAIGMTVSWVLGVLASGRRLDLWQLLDRAGRRTLLIVAAHLALGQIAARAGGVGDLAVALGAGGRGSTSAPYLSVAICGVLFVGLDLAIEQLVSSSRLSNPANTLLLGVVRLRGWMIAAEMSAAALAVLVYPSMNAWSAVMATGMLLLMRQSFALLLEMRASYDATIEVVARSIGESDARRRGQAKRVANMVSEAARRIGIGSTQLEAIRYAALFHDIGRIGADEAERSERTSSELLADVKLLAGALPILQMLDGTEPSTSPDEHVVIGAYLIARFNDIDSRRRRIDELVSVTEESIGARLYASTRKSVDRVIAQIEQNSAAAGEGPDGPGASDGGRE